MLNFVFNRAAVARTFATFAKFVDRVGKRSTGDEKTGVFVRSLDGCNALAYASNANGERLEAVIPASVQGFGDLVIAADDLNDRIRAASGESFALEVGSDPRRVEFADLPGRGLAMRRPIRFTDPTNANADAEDALAVITLTEGRLLDALRRIEPIMPSEKHRTRLNGALFEVGPSTLTIVTTDGHRLSRHVPDLSEVPERPASSPVTSLFIVPSWTIRRALAFFKKRNAGNLARIRLSSENVVFEVDGFRLHSSLIAGEYPDWHQHIPLDNPRLNYWITMNRAALLDYAARAVAVTKGKGRKRKQSYMAICGDDGGAVELQSDALPVESIPAQVETAQNRAFCYALDACFLADALDGLGSDQVLFAFDDHGKACRVTAANPQLEGSVHVVMSCNNARALRQARAAVDRN